MSGLPSRDGGEHHRAAVQREPVRRGDGHAQLGEHADHRGRRVVRVVAQPQRVPLPPFHDRGERVEEQDERAARRHGLGPGAQRGALVGLVHDPEAAVDDDVGGATEGHGREPVRPEPVEPGAAVWTGELHRRATGRQHARGDDGRDGVAALLGEGGGLAPQHLLGHGDVVGELGETTPRAQPHPQGVDRVYGGVVRGRKQLRGGLVAEVEDDPAVTGPAEPAGHRCGRACLDGGRGLRQSVHGDDGGTPFPLVWGRGHGAADAQ